MADIFRNDPFCREDEGSDKFLDPNTWRDYFSDNCEIKPSYITIDDEVSLLLITTTPSKQTDAKPILFIPGWFSNITSWIEMTRDLADKTRIYYFDTREKTSARLTSRNIDFSVEAMADDFARLVEVLPDRIEDVIVIASSMGGTMMFNYLARYKRYPFQTIFIGPNPRIKSVPIIGPVLLHLPLFMFKLSIKYVTWHLRTFRLDAKNEPEQIEKYLQVVRLAIPWRMRSSAQKVVKYDGWKDIERIDAPTIFVAATIDKLHKAERTRKIRDMIPGSGLLEFRSNLDVHSSKLSAVVYDIATGDNSSVIWD